MKGTKAVRLVPIQKAYLWGTEDWLLSYEHKGFEEITLLVKKITAREPLSVQVHPGDGFAWEQEHSRGKMEMWYVTDCRPGAFLYYGLKHRISPIEFQKRIENQTILEVCRKVPVKKGDVFYIPAGLLHAIGKGITVIEVQQSSDITYRVYDYGREDQEHRKRPLHVEKAVQVAGWAPPLQGRHPMGFQTQKNGYSRTLLVQCPYFVVQLYEVDGQMEGEVRTSFQSVLILKGSGTLRSGLESQELNQGDSFYFPQDMGSYMLTGKLQILISEVGTNEVKVWDRRNTRGYGAGAGQAESGYNTGSDSGGGGLCKEPKGRAGCGDRL